MTASPPLHRGLYEVHLPVSDLRRSVEFYRRLGLRLGFGSVHDQSALLLYERGGTRWMLGLFVVDVIAHRHPAEYHVALRVSEADVDGMIPYLRERGIDPVHPETAPIQGGMHEPIVHGWMPAASVFFRDPDGHLLELIAELSDEPRPKIAYLPLSEWRK
ncbi:MAG: VOC family protein [Gemmatimonadota bacterium]|jgi:lactoylglutathione lyase